MFQTTISQSGLEKGGATHSGEKADALLELLPEGEKRCVFFAEFQQERVHFVIRARAVPFATRESIHPRTKRIG